MKNAMNTLKRKSNSFNFVHTEVNINLNGKDRDE